MICITGGISFLHFKNLNKSNFCCSCFKSVQVSVLHCPCAMLSVGLATLIFKIISLVFKPFLGFILPYLYYRPASTFSLLPSYTKLLIILNLNSSSLAVLLSTAQGLRDGTLFLNLITTVVLFPLLKCDQQAWSSAPNISLPLAFIFSMIITLKSCLFYVKCCT